MLKTLNGPFMKKNKMTSNHVVPTKGLRIGTKKSQFKSGIDVSSTFRSTRVHKSIPSHRINCTESSVESSNSKDSAAEFKRNMPI